MNTKNGLKAFLNLLLRVLAAPFLLLTTATLTICIVIGLPIWFATGNKDSINWSIRLMEMLTEYVFQGTK